MIVEIIFAIGIIALVAVFILPTKKQKPWVYKEGEKVPLDEKTLKNYLDNCRENDKKRLRRIK